MARAVLMAAAVMPPQTPPLQSRWLLLRKLHSAASLDQVLSAVRRKQRTLAGGPRHGGAALDGSVQVLLGRALPQVRRHDGLLLSAVLLDLGHRHAAHVVKSQLQQSNQVVSLVANLVVWLHNM